VWILVANTGQKETKNVTSVSTPCASSATTSIWTLAKSAIETTNFSKANVLNLVLNLPSSI